MSARMCTDWPGSSRQERGSIDRHITPGLTELLPGRSQIDALAEVQQVGRDREATWQSQIRARNA